ncbi:Ciliary neurotrophic factor receptor subunit alpha [Bagarius yarrelli]|uniref:Ciliary neurotrophic factor receptor subunit alpha n=1 Tax=Bagarius yarrelli TaxID=175774 RepID=A0A556VA42_BAGYA|nr:Ciliary neurotrophic factor receptor subunit alpha [Bagarius yarrelli]
MANIVTSVCYMVLAAVVVVYAQRRGQQGGRIQYARIGSNVTMQCGSLDNDASVTWKVNGTDVKAKRREEGPRLILMEVDMSSNGLYSCFQNPDGQRRDQITFRIGLPPREPQVTCRSNTYPKGFYCSWHLLHPTYIPTEFEVDVQHNQKSLEVKRDDVHKNRCHVKFPELFSSYSYRVNVTAVNELGRASTAISFEESNMVKPDPPERVVAKPIPNNSRRLEVTWNSPSTWPDIESFPLKYFLRYRPLIRDQWQHVELSDSTAHTIIDAYVGKEYIIQVAAKDMEIGTWSDWSVAVHATPWTEEPKPITSTTEVDLPIETTPSAAPPSPRPRVGGATGGCSALLCSSHILLACVLLSMMWSRYGPCGESVKPDTLPLGRFSGVSHDTSPLLQSTAEAVNLKETLFLQPLIDDGIKLKCHCNAVFSVQTYLISDVQFAAVGSTVTLSCRNSHPGMDRRSEVIEVLIVSFGRSPVVWTHNGSLVRTRQTHPSDGSLTLTNATHSMEGNYSCHEPRGGVLLNSITLRLGYAPEYLSVSCKLPSHFKILCTWTQRVRTHLPTKYISSYSVDNSRPEPCEQMLMDVNECTISNFTFWASKHLVNITEVNPLGSKSTIAFVDVDKNLKPDAPEEVICEQVNAEPTQLFIHWKPPASWPSDRFVAFPLKFELQYKPVGSKFWSKLETDDTSMVIVDALMGHLHQIRVRAQDALINHSQWSEWSQVVQGQPWSDPSMISETTTDDVFEPIFPSTFPVKATEKSPDVLGLWCFGGWVSSTLTHIMHQSQPGSAFIKQAMWQTPPCLAQP